MEMNAYQMAPLGVTRIKVLTAARLANEPIPRMRKIRVGIVLHSKSQPIIKPKAVAVYTPDTIITRIPSRFSSSTYKVGDGERGFRGIAQ
jgi:hypothetical protein